MKKIVSLLLLAVMLCTAFCACGQSDEAAVEGLVDDMFAAIKAEDFDKFIDLYSPDSRNAMREEMEDEQDELFEIYDGVKYKVKSVTVAEDGKTAVAKVEITVTYEGETQTQERSFPAVKVDGSWYFEGNMQ